MEKLLLNAREAASALQLSARHLWSLTSPRGPIPAIRLGRRILYDAKALAMFVRELQSNENQQ